MLPLKGYYRVKWFEWHCASDSFIIRYHDAYSIEWKVLAYVYIRIIHSGMASIFTEPGGFRYSIKWRLIFQKHCSYYFYTVSLVIVQLLPSMKDIMFLYSTTALSLLIGWFKERIQFYC
ncbi:hypothetical protein F4810DRAFT_193787 [Camillea tinctor]|nr:hypothetical protein F4810DRAFT_193787 [Camillea tinctor]